MKLAGRIPVEPLDEERLVNIERRLVVGVSELSAAPARAPRRGLGFAAAAFAVVAAALLGWKLHAPHATPVAPAEPDVLAVTTDTDHATLDLGGGATLASAPGTRLAVARTPARIVVTMTRGTVDLAVEHRADRVLVIRAGDTEIEDIGTKFSVTYDGAQHVEVRVTEGEVQVTRHQHVDRVLAGSAWSDGALVALAAPPGPDTASGSGATIGDDGHDAGAGAVQVAVESPPVVLHDRQAAVPDATRPRRPNVRAAASGPSRPVLGEPLPRTRPAPPTDPYVDLSRAIRREPIDFDPGIDGKADATAEVARLKKIAYSPTTLGADAAAALYRIAVLLHRPLGQDAEALRTLEMYRRRFAAGREHHAAAWLRLRIECGHKIDESCRQAAYSFQHEVVTGEKADVAIRITNAQ